MLSSFISDVSILVYTNMEIFISFALLFLLHSIISHTGSLTHTRRSVRLIWSYINVLTPPMNCKKTCCFLCILKNHHKCKKIANGFHECAFWYIVIRYKIIKISIRNWKLLDSLNEIFITWNEYKIEIIYIAKYFS